MMNRVVLGALASAMLAGAASADTLTLTFSGVNPEVNVSFSTNSGGTWDGTQAGVFTWNGGYKTFCTELGEHIGGGQTVTYNCVAPSQVPTNPGFMGTVRAEALQTLFALNYNAGMLASGTQSAAFQALIWEISHDTTLDDSSYDTLVDGLGLGTGSFRLTSGDGGVLTAADGFIGALQARTTYLAYDNLVGLQNYGAQDQLIVVPLPTTAMLAGLGLIGAAATRRRFLKR